ncbi:deleted in malignant brain tumors 1 protein-like [Mytilus trossulus]|uniref:deleted in malignant brain tumors 1 protein-like n=1 Tax=Mytilus trossulus TaxID=6551 RepID=UPI003005BAE7
MHDMMILRVLLHCCAYVCIQAQRLGTYSLTGENHTALQGRVEIRLNGTSGTVCDDKFDNSAATVVCRVLGHTNGGIAVLDHRFGPGTGPIWYDDLVCRGDEQNLDQCMAKPLNNSNCNHKEDVGVICNIQSRAMQISNSSITYQIIEQPSNCANFRTNLDVRLIGPLNLIGIGYVEIKHNGVWGSICDDLWSLNDAKVICRMLCFDLYCVQAGGPDEIIAGINQVSTNYLLDDVECTGEEHHIRDCKRSNWSIHNCRPEHKEFASVTCIPLKNERPPVPVPTMKCTNGTFNVQFSRYQDRFLLTEHLSVKNNSRLCTLTKAINSSTVSIIIPFTEECGSHASGNATHIFYTNQVGYKYTMVQLHVIRDNTYWIDVTCIFARNLEVSKGFTPITDAFTKTALGRFFISMSFYRQQGPCNDTCFIELLDPVRLYVGEWLNVAVSLTSFVQDDLKLIVPMCRATPTNNRYDAISASLFSNKYVLKQIISSLQSYLVIVNYASMVSKSYLAES